MSFFNLGEYLIDRLVDLGYGERAAIVSSDSGEVTSYAQLQQEVRKMVNAFQSLGLRREERIGLILRDRKEFVVSFLASAKFGCVVLPMNPAVAVHTTCLTLKEALCRVIISEVEYAQELVSEFTDGEKFIFVGSAVLPADMRDVESRGVFTWTDLQTKAEPTTFCCPTTGDSPCYWACTSGTTGLPKIAMHRHADLKILSELYAGEVLLMSLGRQDISFSAAPIFHTYGQGNAMFALSYAATIVLEEVRPISPKRIAHIVRTYRPTLFYSVPTVFNALVQVEEPADSFASIRIAVSAGEPLPDTIFDSFRKVYGIDIIDGIGSTEAGHVYCSNRVGNLTRNSCGFAIPGYELQLRDDVGKDIPSVKGAIGTLYVKSPSAAIGYYCKFEKSRATFQGEWLNSGDSFEVVENGCYYYLGRNDDMMKIKGEWVSPLFLENILLSHELVSQVSIIGDKDSNGLTEAVACLVLKDPSMQIDEDIFHKHFAENNVPSFQRPSVYLFLRDLPKNGVGKILKTELRKYYTSIKIEKAAADSSSIVSGDFDFEDIERFVVTTIAEVTGGNERLERSLTLTEMGIDSSNIVRIVNGLKRRFSLTIPFSRVYHDSLDDLLQSIKTSGSGTLATEESVNWTVECQLEQSIINMLIAQRSDKAQAINPRAIFLTGATGFLGLHILKCLLDLYSTVEMFKVFVLIRGGNAETRLWTLAGQYGLAFYGKLKARVVVVNGELGPARFGLSEVQFEELANSVDIVIHNGATVNWLLDYRSLKSSNVVGTLEALRLCAQGNKKRFVFVSSISAFLQGEEKNEDISYDVPSAAMNTMNGYGSTKRISDILVEQAIKVGLDGYICRPGTIGGSLETGCCNQNDTINRFLRTVCEAGNFPNEVSDSISIAPVDRVATIICVSASLENCPRAFTIIGDPMSTSDIIVACSNRSGIKINKVPLREFYEKISSEECALSPVISFFENASKLPIQNERDVYNCRNFDKVVKMIQSSHFWITTSTCKYEKGDIESYLGKLVFRYN